MSHNGGFALPPWLFLGAAYVYIMHALREHATSLVTFIGQIDGCLWATLVVIFSPVHVCGCVLFCSTPCFNESDSRLLNSQATAG